MYAAVLAAALAAVLGGLAAAPPARAVRSDLVIQDSRKVVARVMADPRRTVKRAIPRSFVGFSVEFESVKPLTGVPFLGVNPIATELFRAISRRRQGPPSLRVGGGSADVAWYDPTGRGEPPAQGLHFRVDDQFFEGLDQFTRETGSRVIFGLNLAVYRPDLAAEMARAAVGALGAKRLESFEVGSKPDLYADRPLYRTPDGTEVDTRPGDYDVADYLRDMDGYRHALRDAANGVKLAGPSSALAMPGWLGQMRRVVRHQRGALNMVTTHEYPLNNCGRGPRRPKPTLGQLLHPATLEGPTRRAQENVRIARRHGLKHRVTETSSSACGGAARVSDVFGSALWAADWMLHLAAAGSDGINFRASNTIHSPFAFGFEDGRYTGHVAPLYYAVLLFAEAAPGGTRMVPSAWFPEIGDGLNVSSFATYDRRRRTMRVALLLKGGRRNGDVVIKVPRAASRASVKRLEAPSFFSQSGITWAGQTIRNPTADGRLRGDLEVQKVRRRNGAFRFHAEMPSAVLLTVRLKRRR